MLSCRQQRWVEALRIPKYPQLLWLLPVTGDDLPESIPSQEMPPQGSELVQGTQIHNQSLSSLAGPSPWLSRALVPLCVLAVLTVAAAAVSVGRRMV